jgi:hypothetical protein
MKAKRRPVLFCRQAFDNKARTKPKLDEPRKARKKIPKTIELLHSPSRDQNIINIIFPYRFF